MTAQESIKHLKEIKGWTNFWGGCYKEKLTAIEIAIEALEKQVSLERIVERLEEERTLLKEERKEAIEYDDEQIIFATNNQIRAFDYSLKVIREESGMNKVLGIAYINAVHQ